MQLYQFNCVVLSNRYMSQINNSHYWENIYILHNARRANNKVVNQLGYKYSLNKLFQYSIIIES